MGVTLTAAQCVLKRRSRLGAAGRILLSLLPAGLIVGCVSDGRPLTAREREVAAAARPILELDPSYVWSHCFNRLLDLAPTSINYLARQPAMRARAAPDDLEVMLHTSLMRLLANPATAPRLSATCFETTLDVLHFDIKVRGRRPGMACMPRAEPPRAWHDLYPFDFDHHVAGRIDVEGDRRAMLRWWRGHAGQAAMLATNRRFRPKPESLWRLLSRRYADRWGYLPEREVVLCADVLTEPALLQGQTHDYNLVRAVCLFLGSRDNPVIQDRLIEMVGSPVPVLSYNARLALSFSRDVRIRELIQRYKRAGAVGAQRKGPRASEDLPMRL